MVRELTGREFEKEVLQSSLPVMVDVWAPWCGPCHAISPIVDAVAKKFAGRVNVYKLNADDNAEIVQRYRVMGIPSQLIFKDGELVDRLVGVQPESAITRKLGGVAELTPDESAASRFRLGDVLRQPRMWVFLAFAVALILMTVLRAF